MFQSTSGQVLTAASCGDRGGLTPRIVRARKTRLRIDPKDDLGQLRPRLLSYESCTGSAPTRRASRNNVADKAVAQRV